MITLLYGPDGYRRDARKKMLINAARDTKDVRVFDAAEKLSLTAFREFTGAVSLFGRNPLTIITSIYDGDDNWISILKSLAKDTYATIIVIADEKPKGMYAFLLKKPVLSESFEYAKGSDWKLFIESEAKKLDVVLAPETIRVLMYAYEKNTWGLITELEKLRDAGDRIIYPDDLLIAHGVPSDFWSMMNQFKSTERRVRLKTLEEVLARDDPAKLFYILGAQLKGREAAVAHADLAIKSGKVDYEEALLGLLL